MFYWIKNTLPLLVNYENITFDGNKYSGMCDMTSVSLEKSSNIIISQKAYDLKDFLEYHICVKEYFDIFLSTLKYIRKQKIKCIIKLAKTLGFFV